MSIELKMRGSYIFSKEEIENQVEEGRVGNYALGHKSDDKKSFIVNYVGRSDTDLRRRLLDHIGEHPEKYTRFKYSYADSKKDAYEKECRNYHDFGGGGCFYNEIHPDKPEGMNYLKCPICKK